MPWLRHRVLVASTYATAGAPTTTQTNASWWRVEFSLEVIEESRATQ